MRVRRGVPALTLTATLTLSACSSASVPTPASGLDLPSLSRTGACASVVVERRNLAISSATVGVGESGSDKALFDIGSAAKSVTAAAVLLLQQRGRLDTSASIARYLVGVPVRKRSITLAQLLDHSSGLPQDFASDQEGLARDVAIRRILMLPTQAPGQFSYSNAGYTLLAAIVERVSGVPFREFVSEQLLRPAGMLHTGWYGHSPAGTAAVDGYVKGKTVGPAGSQAPASWATLGAGGMTSTASDMARWVWALSSGEILDAAETTAMFTPREALGPPGAYLGYGWVLGKTSDGAPVRLVGGDTDFGFTSDLRYYPRSGVVTVALSCSDVSTARDVGSDLAHQPGVAA